MDYTIIPIIFYRETDVLPIRLFVRISPVYKNQVSTGLMYKTLPKEIDDARNPKEIGYEDRNLHPFLFWNWIKKFFRN